jgi:hypothetical protein
MMHRQAPISIRSALVATLVLATGACRTGSPPETAAGSADSVARPTAAAEPGARAQPPQPAAP